MTSDRGTPDLSELPEGMIFLLDRGLLAPAAELEDGMLYGITQDGLRAIYMLGLVMATGVSAKEVEGAPQDADSSAVARCAFELVTALDNLGVEVD